MELLCCVQNYHWGKVGMKSLAGNLYCKNNEKELENIKYAELWMGTHTNGPSVIKYNMQLLSDYISENSNVLGEDVMSNFGKALPFLFKVLSVDTALSIQVHPSKSQAELLYKTTPNEYKDANHKPELAIALSQFETLCGFRPVREIKQFLDSLPELQSLIKKNNLAMFSENMEKCFIKLCFADLMTADETQLKTACGNLLERLKISDGKTRKKLLANLFEDLYSQYPNDVGLFCIYWLNVIKLEPGEALYLPANEPHAYIHGDCIECMANSDNVIRAGLTPKFRDVDALIEMLSYTCHTPEEIIFKPIAEDQYTLLYKPPVKDFAVCKINLTNGVNYILIERKSASIIICVDGTGTISSELTTVDLKPGTVLFLPSSTELSVKCSENLMLFQAFCNI